LIDITAQSQAKSAVAQSTTVTDRIVTDRIVTDRIVTDRIVFGTSAMAQGIPGIATAFYGTRMTRHDATGPLSTSNFERP
jgi:hypothetical protein